MMCVADLCIHDLDPVTCAVCTPPSWREPPPEAAAAYGPWFAAAYYGSCAGCPEDIEPDDMIRADGEGGYLCRTCGSQGEDSEREGKQDVV